VKIGARAGTDNELVVGGGTASPYRPSSEHLSDSMRTQCCCVLRAMDSADAVGHEMPACDEIIRVAFRHHQS
jgi:hypothetical protein